MITSMMMIRVSDEGCLSDYIITHRAWCLAVPAGEAVTGKTVSPSTPEHKRRNHTFETPGNLVEWLPVKSLSRKSGQRERVARSQTVRQRPVSHCHP